jgi:hypothetical protein
MYSWKILEMTTNTVDGYPEFVRIVRFQYFLTQGENTVSTLSSVVFTQQSGTFTPYDQLTEEQVIGWLQNTCDMTILNTTLDCKMAAVVNPIPPSPNGDQNRLPPWSQA